MDSGDFGNAMEISSIRDKSRNNENTLKDLEKRIETLEHVLNTMLDIINKHKSTPGGQANEKI